VAQIWNCNSGGGATAAAAAGGHGGTIGNGQHAVLCHACGAIWHLTNRTTFADSGLEHFL
jgi:hypothetical protein